METKKFRGTGGGKEALLKMLKFAQNPRIKITEIHLKVKDQKYFGSIIYEKLELPKQTPKLHLKKTKAKTFIHNRETELQNQKKAFLNQTGFKLISWKERKDPVTDLYIGELSYEPIKKEGD